MKQRCGNPKVSAYRYYGGRGIRICDEWQTFEPFMDWAFRSGYQDDLTIDRIDTDGDYTPDNCRWVTQAEQMSNVRSNRAIEYAGESHSLAQWSRITGLKRETIAHRIDRGWTVGDALTKEVMHG